jgi:hypothetical protein
MAVMKKAAMKKASSLKKQLKPLGADKAELKKAAAKKADPMKASAASHQKSLAKIAGTTAAIKAGKNLPKQEGRFINERIAGRSARITSTAANKAEKRTLKSFK